jgi:valyl-tRNA synthetase
MSLIKLFGADTVRLYLMSENASEIIYRQELVASYHDFLSKFWNACRYVATNAQEKYGKKKINLTSLEKEIGKNMADLHDFDLRMLNKIKNLYQEIDASI